MKAKGFTIIEMLIVMSIIGVIALMIMPHVISARFKADLTACVSNERNIAQCLEMSKNNTGMYPERMRIILEAGLMVRLPVCPSNNGSYEEAYEVDDNGTMYTISCPGIHNLYLKNIRPGFPQYYSTTGLNIGEQ